jgi:hypothetical protein
MLSYQLLEQGSRSEQLAASQVESTRSNQRIPLCALQGEGLLPSHHAGDSELDTHLSLMFNVNCFALLRYR